jgi:hypothetical protein
MNMRESECVCGREGDSAREIYRGKDTGGTHAYNLITVYIFARRIYALTSSRALCHTPVHFACTFRRHPRFPTCYAGIVLLTAAVAASQVLRC